MYCNGPAERLRELYNGAFMFVVSWDVVGLGMVILEAMACGLPVFNTACSGPATVIVVGETGLLTQVGDANALAKALQSLWEKIGITAADGANRA